jgi:hypothetical protein
MSKFGLAIIAILLIEMSLAQTKVLAADSTVYQVFRGVDLGETDRPPPKDIYINMGSSQGIKRGSVLDVYRKVTSFDELTQKVAGDQMIPIGRVKIIHSDEKTSIARLDKFVSIDQEPALGVQSIMVGDVVRPAGDKD